MGIAQLKSLEEHVLHNADLRTHTEEAHMRLTDLHDRFLRLKGDSGRNQSFHEIEAEKERVRSACFQESQALHAEREKDLLEKLSRNEDDLRRAQESLVAIEGRFQL